MRRRVLLTLRGGEQDRFATHNHDGVLIVRGKTAVDGSIGRAVLVERDMARAGGTSTLTAESVW